MIAVLAVGMLQACSDSPGTSPPSDVADGVDEAAEDATTEPDAAEDLRSDRAEQDVTADPIEEITPDAPIEDGSNDQSSDATVEELLRISAVSPGRGPSSGGTEILIVGLGFTFDSDVFLGGALCEDIDVIDDTKIVCDTPPNPAGVYDVKVINDFGVASLAGGFTYVDPVVIESITPDRGPTMGGMPATIEGLGFTDDAQVSIGGHIALGVEVLDSRTIRLITPPGSPGASRVQVSSASGLTSLEDGFLYYTPVSIDRVLPGAGLASGGEAVVIEGEGFTDTDDLSVVFDLLDADFDVISTTELEVTTPPGPVDTLVDVTVASALNGDFTARDGFYYYDSAVGLQVFHVAPARGSTAGGDVVVVSGANLSDVDTVSFGGIDVTPDVVDDRYVIVETPPHAVGSVDVEVSDGTSSDTLTSAFTYVQAVVVDSIAPSSGDVAGGTAVTITGSGFAAPTTVRIGALPATDVDVVSATEISASTPPGVVGPADVVVKSSNGVQGVLAGGFVYTADVQVHGFSPSKGAMSGGTVVIVHGAGFVEPLTLTFDGQPATAVELLDSATLTARTPPHDPGFADVAVTPDGGEPVSASDRFLYFDPVTATGGQWGDSILGAVNVSVLGSNGAPLSEAFVQLNVRAEADYFGYTDANGQVTLSGLDLSGEQTVTATRVGFSSATVHAVDAENITVVLFCVPENLCGSTADCRDGFVCTCGPPYSGGFPGICLEENYCGFEPQSQEEFDNACVADFGSVPYGLITGTLTGVHKVDDPGPHEQIRAWVFTTQPHPFQRTPVSPGSDNDLLDDGPYTLRSRVGEIALVALCGLYNTETDIFHPSYMAVQRDLFIVDGETYTIDLDCNIRLDQTLTIKTVNSPLGPNGPETLEHVPYLHFGTEGYFGNFGVLAGTDDVLSLDGFAPLEGELTGLDYYIKGGAFTGEYVPIAWTILEGVTEVDEVITLPEFVPVAELTTPSENNDRLLIDRFIEWDLTTDAQPDFFSILICQYSERILIWGCDRTTYWEVLVPGDQTSVNLPWFSEDAQVGTFAPGELLFQILAVDAYTFDYNNFDAYTNFSLSNWRSFSINAYVINNPG